MSDRTEPPALRGLKLGHLRLMAELGSDQPLGLAAERLGLAQPAASRLLAEIERIVGRPVHERVGRSIRLTAIGQALARRAGRIDLELRDALREVADAASGSQGHVRIGSVTGPALSMVLPVLAQVRATLPAITVEVSVATSDRLCAQVLSGELDFALGRVAPADGANLQVQLLGDEPLSLVVRRGHPLLARPDLRIEDALGHDWVMPEDETLLTRTILAHLARAGLAAPFRQVSTASFLLTLALLRDTDAVAPMASAVARRFAGEFDMPFMQLPIDLDLRVEPFGLVQRKGATLPPAPQRLADLILRQANPGLAG